MSHRSALGLAHAAIMDITNQKDSAGIAEASRQVPADIPEPLYGDADNFKSSWPRRSRMAAAATFWKTCDEGGGASRITALSLGVVPTSSAIV